jgi:hypothetical protein
LQARFLNIRFQECVSQQPRFGFLAEFHLYEISRAKNQTSFAPMKMENLARLNRAEHRSNWRLFSQIGKHDRRNSVNFPKRAAHAVSGFIGPLTPGNDPRKPNI